MLQHFCEILAGSPPTGELNTGVVYEFRDFRKETTISGDTYVAIGYRL